MKLIWVYLRKVGLAGIQRYHRGVVRGQYLPEEGKGLREGGGGSQICRWEFHLPGQKGPKKDKAACWVRVVLCGLLLLPNKRFWLCYRSIKQPNK